MEKSYWEYVDRKEFSGYDYVTDMMMHGLKLHGTKKPVKNQYATWDAAFKEG